jgi:DNA-binding MarR family transcriptional regulator
LAKKTSVVELAASIERRLLELSADAKKILDEVADQLADEGADLVSANQVAKRELDRRKLRNRVIRAERISANAFDVLLLLFSVLPSRQSLAMTEIMKELAIPGTTVARWLLVLEERGLIERTQRWNDARVVDVSLTERARQSMARYISAVRASIGAIMPSVVD